ncbi:hypothetical protein [Psychroflexus halocasei]|uniref:Glycosyl transferase family 2 n=1 Tax=Psychroflexus halocasei TaxID=908615 RepID=A0A1H4D9B3_9FLAO|nr:hypothetical protein [Psychroflexus halocasei]SEA69281.1 hypothetical protein SAMN05421540_11027 [Psychroflexus halocasei]
MLVDFLDKIYSSLVKLNKFQSFLRFIIRRSAQLIVPVWFKSIPSSSNVLGNNNCNNNVTVTLTTFPERINKLWIVIECLLRQTSTPDKILIWLSKEQFPNGFKNIPKSLMRYLNLNLIEIFFVDDDLRSHKKYYYAFQKFPQDVLITIDDDIIYPSNIIFDLLNLHEHYPDTICCLRGWKVLHNEDGEIIPYKDWDKISGLFGPNLKIFHTSGGGTLYRTNFFSKEVLNNEVFMQHCFYADDVWLNIMAQLNKTKTVKGEYFSNLLPVQNASNKLSVSNVEQGGNDEQIKALINYYKIKEHEIFS